MSSQRIGMGRGLAAILPEAAAGPELREVPIELIRPNPRQPRSSFEPEALAALTVSVAAAGVIQPLIVRPVPGGTYELIAGERRWRAAREAGLDTVPAVVRDEDEARRLQTALIENMAREDLNAVEEARACAALVEELGMSKAEVARVVGRSRAALSNLIRILDLPDAALALLESGRLSEGHGRAILQLPEAGARASLARSAAEEGWSVRQTEERARRAAGTEKAARHSRRKGGTVTLHPDQEAARAVVEDLLSTLLGAEVGVRVEGAEAVAELRCASLAELAEIAEAAARRRAA